jgi:hypothetical protein
MDETLYRRLSRGGIGRKVGLHNVLLPRRGNLPLSHLIASVRSEMPLALRSLGIRAGHPLPH